MSVPCVLLVCVISGILGHVPEVPVAIAASIVLEAPAIGVQPVQVTAPVIMYNYTHDVREAFIHALSHVHHHSQKDIITSMRAHFHAEAMKPDFQTLCPMPRREPETQADSIMAELGLDAITHLSSNTGVSVHDILRSDQWRDALYGEFLRYCGEKASHFHCDPLSPYRTIDGSCNNIAHPAWGMMGMPQKRFLPPDYADGYNSPRAMGEDGLPLPNPRAISNLVHNAGQNQTKVSKLSAMMMTWGQFITHDIVNTPLVKDEHGQSLDCCGKDHPNLERTLRRPGESNNNLIMSSTHHDVINRGLPTITACIPIAIPVDDPHFSTSCMNVMRTAAAAGPVCSIGVRRQINKVTSYLDGSAVYGSTQAEANLLRKREYGLLREGHYGLLPPTGKDNCILQKQGQQCQLAGDERPNVVASVGALHTLFMREHNRIALRLHDVNPTWDDETLYQETRKVVAAIIQHITFNEYLPLIIGKPTINYYNLDDTEFGHLDSYRPYVNAGIATGFSAAAFRFGHSQIPRRQTYIGPKFEKRKGVPIEKTFHKPYYLQRSKHFGYEGILRWLITDEIPVTDRCIEDGVRNKLFMLHNVSLDLAAINIQRGREQGVPSYNEWRKWCGLPEATRFEASRFGGLRDHDNETVALLGEIYRSTNDIDLFTGGVSEIHVDDGSVGPTFACIIARQFSSLKAGDRFWYDHNDTTTGFTSGQLDSIKQIQLSKLICENMDIPDIQRNAFLTPKISGVLTRHIPCSFLPDLEFFAWLDTKPKWVVEETMTTPANLAAEKPAAAMDPATVANIVADKQAATAV